MNVQPHVNNYACAVSDPAGLRKGGADACASTKTEGGAGRFSAPGLKGATGPLIGLILLCVFLTFATDKFMSVRNILNVMDQISVLGIMAVGMTLVILIGGIDLAVGSVLALAMMVMGYLFKTAGMPMGVAIVLALAVSALSGAVSGLLITLFRVPPSSPRWR